MRAVLFRGEGRLEIADVPDPVADADGVIVRVEASGICGSDLHTLRGPTLSPPVIAGHEPAGVVVDVGSSVDRSWVGRRVMIHHYIGCGFCDQCRIGWSQMCRRGATAMGATAPGAHAEFMSVPFRTILPMPDGLSDLAAAAISCGTGTAWGALHRMGLTGRDTIAIFGQGPVGLAATQLASSLGARVIALDVSPSRLTRAHEFGAVELLNPAGIESVPDAIKDLTGGRGVSRTLETSGATSAATAALHSLDLWGVGCFVGIGSTVHFDLTEHLFKQITVLPSWTLSVNAMEECARYVVGRDIDVDSLFTDRWSLDDGHAAYDLAASQTAGKGVFLPNR